VFVAIMMKYLHNYPHYVNYLHYTHYLHNYVDTDRCCDDC